MKQRISDSLRAIELRREANEFPCDSCYATGLYEGLVCSDCLGQKVRLHREEYDALLELSDSILDAEILN